MTNEDLVSRMSTERIEQNIANIYWEFHREQIEAPGWSKGLLGIYWREFDKRVEAGQVKDLK